MTDDRRKRPDEPDFDPEEVERDEEAVERPADLPEGFEHLRFRATPEAAEALRKMTVMRDD